MTVEYVATADNDQCWQILFSSLPGLEASGNTWIEANVNGLFKNHPPAEVRRMLVNAYARGTRLSGGG